MSTKVAVATQASQSPSCDPSSAARDLSADTESPTCDLDFIVDLFNEAIEDSPWAGRTEALATAMDIDRGYLSKVRSKDKPLNLKILRALPDDIEAIFAAKWAEAFGLIVVAPVHGQDAVKCLVSGLIGVLSPRLPERSSGQLKATLPEPVSQRRRA